MGKPTGHIGPITISADGSAQFDRVEFPEEKEQVENYIVDLTLLGCQRIGLDPWGVPPKRNPENHFDFTLPLRPHPEYLELMEVAPLEGTSGFQGATLEYSHGNLADWVWTKLTKKAQAYGLPRREGIHLLTYSTDLAFRLTEGVLEILSYYCAKVDRGFKSILYAVPESRDEVFVYMIYPNYQIDLGNFRLDAMRARKSLIADFTRHEVTPEGSVVVPIGGTRRRGGR